jgi:branched-chain amino acid transport system substrate-binding protein
VGEYWHGKIYVNAELAPVTMGGPDAQNWLAVMDAFGKPEDPRDTFGQAGYLSARFFTDAMLAMDPAQLDDRAAVTAAIRGIKGYTSDLMCGPYYVGDAEFHQPNRAGRMVKVVAGGFELVRDCYEYESAYFDRHKAVEKELGLN